MAAAAGPERASKKMGSRAIPPMAVTWRRSALVAAALLAAGGAMPATAADAAASPPPAASASADTTRSPSPALRLEGGRWYDGRAGWTTPSRPWYVVDGVLTRARPPRVDATVHLGRLHVLPPLAEAHNHNLQNPWAVGQFADAIVRGGTFYSMQMCAQDDMARQARSMLGHPAQVDVAWADACITSSDGHPIGIALAQARQVGMEQTADELRDRMVWTIDSQQDIEAKWPRIAETAPSLVKLILVDSADHARHRADPKLAGFNGLDPALLPELVRRSHAAGARVVVHVDTAADFAVAVRAGADIVAHLPGYRIIEGKGLADYLIDPEVIAQARRQGTRVMTTTVASGHDIARHPAHAPLIREAYRRNLQALRAAGVPLMIGSDEFFGGVVDEIESLDALGAMPRAELIRRAVVDTPQAMFPGRRIGRLEAGAEASFIAYEGDPLVDPKVLRKPVLAVKRGLPLPVAETRKPAAASAAGS